MKTYCKNCGTKLGIDCGKAEQDFNKDFCSEGCYLKKNQSIKIAFSQHDVDRLQEALSNEDNSRIFQWYYPTKDIQNIEVNIYAEN